MRYFIVYLFSAFLVLFVLDGCYYDEEVIPEPESVSFSVDIMPIFNQSCNTSGCHNTGGIPPDLSAVNAFNELDNGGFIDRDNPPNSELYQWLIGNRGLDMPPSGPDQNLNNLVLKWIEEGAINN